MTNTVKTEKERGLVRKNIRMGEEIANWYEEKANILGVSQSNLMVMALAEYIKQEKVANIFEEYKKQGKKMNEK